MDIVETAPVEMRRFQRAEASQITHATAVRREDFKMYLR